MSIDAELKNLEQSVRDILAKIKNTVAKFKDHEDTLTKVNRDLMRCRKLELELAGSRVELVEGVTGFTRNVEEVFQQQLQEGCDKRTIERLLNAFHDAGKVMDRHVPILRPVPTFREKSDAELKNLLALFEDFAAKLKGAKANKFKAEDPQRIRLEQPVTLAQGHYKVASDIGIWFHDVGDVFEEHRKSGINAELAEPMLKMARSADKIVRRHGASEAFQPDFESESSDQASNLWCQSCFTRAELKVINEVRIQSLVYHTEMKALQTTVMDQVGVMFRASGDLRQLERPRRGRDMPAVRGRGPTIRAQPGGGGLDWVNQEVVEYHFTRGTSDETVAPLLKILGGFNKMADQDGSAGKTDPESKLREMREELGMADTAYRTLRADAFQQSNALQIAQLVTVEDEARIEYEFEAFRLALVDSVDVEESRWLRVQMSGLMDEYFALNTEKTRISHAKVAYEASIREAQAAYIHFKALEEAVRFRSGELRTRRFFV
ncbi:hypothetical protein CPC16_002525 [Podila verticillata]|nr:hypothetical protein CPC16_002525 [Podila verticillata]